VNNDSCHLKYCSQVPKSGAGQTALFAGLRKLEISADFEGCILCNILLQNFRKK